MRRTCPNKIFRRFLGLFWPIFDPNARGHISFRILPLAFGSKIGSKEPKNRLKLFIRTGSKIIWALLILCSCSPNSSEEFQQEGEARCRALLTDLQKIENREQLLSIETKLKKHFEAMIDLIIEAREFQQKQVEEGEYAVADRANMAETALQDELRRIYAIEGGREVVEKSQHEALIRLDAYERTSAKKREKKGG